MTNTDKILNLIQNDEQIAINLFLFNCIPDDVSLWTDNNKFDISNIKWLFSTDEGNLSLVGVNTRDNTIWAIDDEGSFHKDCDALQDLPYEIIRIECGYSKSRTTQEYFKKYEKYNYKETLEKYEKWCKDNGIELDKDKIYHDENGNLFTKYFEIN